MRRRRFQKGFQRNCPTPDAAHRRPRAPQRSLGRVEQPAHRGRDLQQRFNSGDSWRAPAAKKRNRHRRFGAQPQATGQQHARSTLPVANGAAHLRRHRLALQAGRQVGALSARLADQHNGVPRRSRHPCRADTHLHPQPRDECQSRDCVFMRRSGQALRWRSMPASTLSSVSGNSRIRTPQAL